MPGNEERTQRGRIEDIRERGFSDRVSVETATSWVDGHSTKLTVEEIDVSEASGRVLADSMETASAIPPADRASSDGYAVRSDDTVGAGDYNPLDLAICQCDELPPAAATPVVAGAPLPRGADAVLPFESARAHGAALEVFSAVAEGCGVERKGQQVQPGTVLIERGRKLLPQDIGLIASLGLHRVQVIRRPRVRLIVGAPKSHGGLCPQGDANSPMLSALVARDGGLVEAMIFGTGQRDAIVHALASPGADLILVAGRTGTGCDDEAPLAIAEAGKLQIHGIALRPGGSAGMGVVGNAPVLLLPGDPLECWCAYEIFAGRLLRRMGGCDSDLPYPVLDAEVGRKIVSAIGITDLYRVSLVDGRAEAIGSAESGGLASAVRADGFVVVPAPLEGYAPGVRVPVHLYRTAGASRT
jgi:molybdopterin molybdotransferase